MVGLLGGSQGALALNRAMKGALDRLTDVQIIWQAGSLHQDQFAVHESARVKVLPFVNDMGAFYAAADVVISRAGALALAEIAACGKPSLLVPFAGAAGDHQTKNAESLRATGAAVVVDERDLTGERMADEVMSMLGDTMQMNQMSAAARSVAKPDAAVQIVEEIEVVATA